MYNIEQQKRQDKLAFYSMWTTYLCMNMLFKNYANKLKVYFCKSSFAVVYSLFEQNSYTKYRKEHQKKKFPFVLVFL